MLQAQNRHGSQPGWQMDRYPKLAGPAYIVAFMLVAIPLFDATMSVFPFGLGNEQWRFGAIGLLSNAFMIPAAGLLIALVTALSFGHFRFLRVLGAICAISSVLVVLLLLLFGLDAVQARLNVNPQAKLSFVVASFTAAAKLILAVITLVLIGAVGLKSKVPSGKAAPARASASAANPGS
jgi:hypothetical protein